MEEIKNGTISYVNVEIYMSELIRKRCPKCKNVDIYKRKNLKDMIEKRRSPFVIKSKIPSKIYICRICGYEFDIPFVGPKN